MQVTMRRVLEACDALWPLMETRGLSGSVQYALMRLWARLAGERAMYLAAELKLARECGTLSEDGKISFESAEAAKEFAARRDELLGEEVAIAPERVKDEIGLWDALTPKALMQLDGLLDIVEVE